MWRRQSEPVSGMHEEGIIDVCLMKALPHGAVFHEKHEDV